MHIHEVLSERPNCVNPCMVYVAGIRIRRFDSKFEDPDSFSSKQES